MKYSTHGREFQTKREEEKKKRSTPLKETSEKYWWGATQHGWMYLSIYANERADGRRPRCAGETGPLKRQEHACTKGRAHI